MKATTLDHAWAWMRLYLVGAWILLLQVVRSLFPVRSLPICPIADLSNTTFVLTGASSGVGRALCTVLLSRGAHVVAISGPSGLPPPECNRIVHADLRDIHSISAVAKHVRAALAATSRPHVVLVHGAGTLSPNNAHIAAAVNLISPALLSVLLRDVVHAVVFLGSAAQAAASELPQNLCGCARVPRDGYPVSKALLHVFADAWGRRTGCKALVVHPGVVVTRLYDAESGAIGRVLRLVLRIIAWDPDTSARKVLDVMQRTGVLDTTGYNTDAQAEYWDTSTMSRAAFPRVICGRKNEISRDLSDRMWNEVLELKAKLDNSE